jgi:hypothetical protein
MMMQNVATEDEVDVGDDEETDLSLLMLLKMII